MNPRFSFNPTGEEAHNRPSTTSSFHNLAQQSVGSVFCGNDITLSNAYFVLKSWLSSHHILALT